MQNPFVPPNGCIKSNHPLCPWEDESHDLYFVNVDGTEEAFIQFQKLSEHINLNSSGYYAIVSGPDGSGKSSLLHRCAYHLKKKLKDKPTLIINLSDEGQPGLAVNKKLATVMPLIADRIEAENSFFTTDVNAKLMSRLNDGSTNSIRFLSDQLLKAKKYIIIILPPIELPDEIKEYIQLCRKSILLLGESSHSSVADYCQRHHGPATQSPINMMNLGLLNIEDGWKFVKAQYSRLEGEFPRIDEIAIREYMETRIQNKGKTTIRELTVACAEVFAFALENSQSDISIDDFARYYLRAGGLS